MPEGWRVRAFGEPDDVLELVELPPEPLGEDEVRIETAAAGVNALDVGMCLGTHPLRPEPPFVLGAEVVGVVTETGAAVRRFRPGERVVAMSPRAHGGFRRDAVVPAAAAQPVPAGVPDEDAAALLVTYQTAHIALVRRARVEPGEWLLVTAAAGALGSALVQVARACGARVIAAAGSDEKRKVCLELGAEAALDSRAPDLAAQARELTGGRGVAVACDLVGGDGFTACVEAAALEGRVLTMGWAGGSMPALEPMPLIMRNLAVLGVSWGAAYPREAPDVVAATHDDVLRLYAAGEIRPLLGPVLPHTALPRALDAIRAGATTGKSVLTWS